MQRSRCGLDCENCPSYTAGDCVGCIELEEGNWAGNCEIKKCCEEKQLEHCGVCPGFPCDLLRNTSFDPDEGDDGERLVTLKEWSEELPDRINSEVTRIVLGISCGTVIGAILGALSGSVLSVTLAGLLTGTAIGILLNIFKSK